MGNVKLNIGGGNSVAETLPTVLASCSAASGNTKAEITWEYTDTDYVAGMRICYKTGGYPENAEDGAYVDVGGAQTLSAAITGLTNNLTYYFRLFPYNENGDYQASVTNALCSTTPFSFAIIAGTATVETGTDDGMAYAIISSSGTFTTVGSPSGGIDVYLVGGGCSGGKGSSTSGTTESGWVSSVYAGGSGGSGGYVYQTELPVAEYEIEYTAVIGAASSPTGTTLAYGDEILECKSGSQKTGGKYASISTNDSAGTISSIYQTATEGEDGILVAGYGYVGSSGGGGGIEYKGTYYGKLGGEGAGHGGGSASGNVKGGAATNYGCGGGGGRAATLSSGYGGAGMQGCIILNWAL